MPTFVKYYPMKSNFVDDGVSHFVSIETLFSFTLSSCLASDAHGPTTTRTVTPLRQMKKPRMQSPCLALTTVFLLLVFLFASTRYHLDTSRRLVPQVVPLGEQEPAPITVTSVRKRFLNSSLVSDFEDEGEEEDTRVAVYTNARHDRSGQHLLCFFNLDAVAFKANAQMGGQCIQGYNPEQQPFKKRLEDAKALIKYLGFEGYFRYECPTKEDKQAGRAKQYKNKQMRPTDQYFTAEWHADFLSRVKYQYEDKSLREKPRVAIHIRRGDVSPCNQWDWHYLTNSYYLNIIDEYLPEYCGDDVARGCDVTIFSETSTAESFDPFIERGIEMKLSGPLEEVWDGIINADVAILSISSFSFIPAVLNRDVVLYPPHMTKDMSIIPGWIQIPESYWDANEIQKVKMKRTICGKQ